MLTLRILTEDGTLKRITVVQAEFIKTCPYCRDEFPTVNPDQIYCKTSHRVNACMVRNFDRTAPRALATATIGISRVLAITP